MTVTLSASDYTGFSVANTYFKVDSGSAQLYSSPFQITGSGPHTLTYWSEDNVGEIEVANILNFTVALDANG